MKITESNSIAQAQKNFNENNLSSDLDNLNRNFFSRTADDSSKSLQNYLKEMNLNEDDLSQLKQSLLTILECLKIRRQQATDYYFNQRLANPYLQSRSNNRNRSSPPLYTDEYFIRNGLLNHNDGPEIIDDQFEQLFSYYHEYCRTPAQSLSNSSNPSLTLTLSKNKLETLALSANLNDLFNKNETRLNPLKTSRSNNQHNEYFQETDSMIVRRDKVLLWERKNVFGNSTCKSIGQNDNFEQDQISPMKSVPAGSNGNETQFRPRSNHFIGKRKFQEEQERNTFPVIKTLGK